MKEFWKAALIRAIRTVAQTAVASIGTAAVLESVDWRFVLSASVLAGILSILTSVATGLPEAGAIVIEEDEELDMDEDIDMIFDQMAKIEAVPEKVREDIEVRDGEQKEE